MIIWIFTKRKNRYIVTKRPHKNPYKTIQETFPDGLPDVVLVHDRWAAHFKCEVYDHQICLAHLFRDLKYIDQVHKSNWAQSLTSILKQAIALNNQADYDPACARSGNPARNESERSLMDLLPA